MHLEHELLADELALEPDVRGLDARARVGAAVDVQGNGVRDLKVGEPLLELIDHLGRQALGLHERKLAEFDAGARNGRTAERAGVRVHAVGFERGGQLRHAVLGNVQDQDLLVGGQPDAVGTHGLGCVGERQQRGGIEATHGEREAHVFLAVVLLVHTHVIGAAHGAGGCGAVREFAAQVLVLQHLAELLGAPFGQQELEAGLGALLAVPVVAEDAGHRGPHGNHVFRCHEHAQSLGQARGDGQRAAHPQVVSDPEFGVLDPHEADVVDLVHHVQALAAGDRGLEFAGQIHEVRVAHKGFTQGIQLRGAIDDLVGVHAGHRAAQEHARGVAARFDAQQTHGIQPLPDLGDVLDADPVQLDVLSVADISGVPGEVTGDLTDHAGLRHAQPTAVRADAHHEVLVGQ